MAAASPRGVRPFLAALLFVYVAKQLVVALVFPPFTGHDEVAHFAEVRIVATEHRIPTLWRDTLPADLYGYRAFTIEWRDRDWSPLYTAVHPPLYYALMAPLYRATARFSPEAIQYFLRCASIPFGAALVVFAYMLAHALFPGDPFLAVTVPTVVAFQPQVSYEAAMVNNDALSTMLYTAVLYGCVLTLRDGASARRAGALGLLAGLALLSKATTVTALVLIPAALVLAARRRGWRAAASYTVVAYACAAVLVVPWWWFMARTYGDPMAFSALASIQPDLTRADVSFLQLLFSGRFLVDRWTETWGEFGWRLVHLSPALTGTLGIVAALCMAGLIVEARRDRVVDLWTDWRAQALVLLGCACLLGYVATAQFGVRFVLTQARYFFSIVDAAALLLMLGLRTLIAPRWRPAAQAVVVFAAIAVTVVVYTAHVAPYWYFR